ncbi:LuxR family transcriptional regulator [bacterium AH-315-P15]|nr:LuxR family transcriptional regulator [bacterium AH-315-P15]
MLRNALVETDPAHLFEEFRKAALNIGYDSAAYVNFAHLELPGSGGASTLAYSTYWVEHYTANDYFDQDILFPLALTNRAPIHWDYVRANCNLTPLQKRIFDDGHDGGLRFGITFPFHGPSGPTATVSVATSGTRNDVPESSLQMLSLASQFHAVYDTLVNPPEFIGPPPRFPPREQEVLGWVAAGKSSWEISVITSLTPNSVDTYIKRSMRRLNVHSRIAAVMVASRLGILQL